MVIPLCLQDFLFGKKVSEQPLHPATAQISPRTLVLGRGLVDSLLGLSITKCEQP